MKNPYWNRTVIREPKDFFGRKNEIKKIFDAIGTPHPQNISIIGDEKIGKSSLLYHVFKLSQKKQELPHPEKYIFIFVVFPEHPNITVDEFFEMLYSELKNKLPEGIRIEQVKNYKTFTNMVKTLDDLGYKLILLINEFDKIPKNEDFKVDFFSYLRAIANRYDIALIISTQKDLEDLSQPDLLGSPFFNIFTQIRLGLFQKEEALNLITGPSTKEGIPFEEDTEFILKNAGLFPFFIQILCHELFEYKKNHDRKIGQEGYNQVLEKFWVEANSYFDHFWKSFSQEEKDVLIEISMGKKVKKGKKSVIRNLKQKGYITTVNGRNQIFSDTFRQFILDHQGEISKTKRKSFIAVLDILLIFIFAFSFFSIISYFFKPNTKIIILGLIVLIVAFVIRMSLFFFRKRRKKEKGSKNSNTVNFLVSFLASYIAAILTLTHWGMAPEVIIGVLIFVCFTLIYFFLLRK
ncbi:MAG: AAA family ATPase [Theionarchaea archaeon]|nr:AAA family ATPase [Theionarchaea archaeon]